MEGSIGLDNKRPTGGEVEITKAERVRMFKPREVVKFEGAQWMISGINTETGDFNLTRGEQSLENISPFKVEKIEELLPELGDEDIEVLDEVA